MGVRILGDPPFLAPNAHPQPAFGAFDFWLSFKFADACIAIRQKAFEGELPTWARRAASSYCPKSFRQCRQGAGPR